MESRMTAKGVKELGGEQKGKRTRGHGQKCGDYGGGWEGIRGLNGNGKNTIKFF